ncbi:ABC transporter ATP-binding protein [Nesterenkonia sp. HG001]|uniref:ABC transporter ATP-binding protein n=1 Tax=Nesterenkonia sp. HG001 TaxID=2983207 RepID=UPI002AC5EAF4|nr:ABC transporter ATP-binding protein [Nesterenkonia sp. HG001]MDZ5077268.1 ABC transporter ATP-binding protein [Nesterenkonia sp. HG001]
MSQTIAPADQRDLEEDGPPHGDLPLLEISGLRTQFETPDGTVKAVDGVDLEVHPGRTLCVVGESGCGKSMTARSVMQLIDPPGRIVEGEMHWRPQGAESVDLAALDPDGEPIRQVRGGQIGMIFQEPMSSLSPMYTVGAHLIEAIRLHREVPKDEARKMALELLRRVGIPQPEQRMDVYPFQLSGGMCQRVMVAIALSCDPALLIADEPTTALDVTTQARILDLLKDVQAENQMAMMFITHDLGVVAEMADDVVVMYLGQVVERGTVEQIFSAPRHPYTRALLDSIPKLRDGGERPRLRTVRGMVPHPQNMPSGCRFRTRCDFAMPGVCDVDMPDSSVVGEGQEVRCHLYSHADGPGGIPDAVEEAPSAADVSADAVARSGVRTRVPVEIQSRPGEDVGTGAATGPLLQVRGLTKHFPIGGGMFRRATGEVRAVDGVDLDIPAGQTLGLVGESGCGKTTLGRCIARLADPTDGQILFREVDGSQTDLAQITGKRLRKYRTQIRTIFQDPFSSLNPRMTVKQIVGEPLLVNGLASGSTLEDRVAEMLKKVGIRPEYMPRYPHAFSGGQRQRLNIARALITDPRLVIADEPVSALDVSVRAQILNLLVDLQEELGLTYLFVSHDLSVVEHVADRVNVMYLGRIAEEAETAELYRQPKHPYTQTLLHSVPVPDPTFVRRTTERATSDEVPYPKDAPDGCLFVTRCPHAQAEPCTSQRPELGEPDAGRRAACHFSESLDLTGIARD